MRQRGSTSSTTYLNVAPEQQLPPSDNNNNEDNNSRRPSPPSWRSFLAAYASGKAWWAQCITIALAATLTYSYHNSAGTQANVQLAIMTVIVMAGALPLPGHILPAATGAFVGGHNIVGATRLHSFGPPEIQAIHYGWLLLLSAVVGGLWCFLMVPRKLLDGYAGRLGSTTFLGMNLVMLLLWGPLKVVDWNRYYFGLVHVVHVAEEDSAPASLASAWFWTEEAELALGYVAAVVWISVVAGATRILHQQHIQQWQNAPRSVSDSPPAPLNNIVIPCLWALLSMLLVNMTQYRYAAGLYNGFAVGSYVAMASLQKIPSIRMFGAVGLVAAAWGLALTPFFVGFAGKSGFTAMVGHATHTFLLERMRRRQQQQQLQASLHSNNSSHERNDTTTLLMSEAQRREEDPEQPPAQEPPSPNTQRRKVNAIEEVYYTKTQRRQQQRLLAQQQQQQQQQTQQQQPQPSTQQLHHRAWRAGDGHWEHPQASSTTASNSE